MDRKLLQRLQTNGKQPLYVYNPVDNTQGTITVFDELYPCDEPRMVNPDNNNTSDLLFELYAEDDYFNNEMYEGTFLDFGYILSAPNKTWGFTIAIDNHHIATLDRDSFIDYKETLEGYCNTVYTEIYTNKSNVANCQCFADDYHVERLQYEVNSETLSILEQLDEYVGQPVPEEHLKDAEMMEG